MTTMTQAPAIHDILRFNPVRTSARVSNLRHMGGLLLTWNERSTQRRHLSALTRRELDDVGISPAAAAVESAKPFWQA